MIARGYLPETQNTKAGYDEPFDLEPELINNQTTPNYRTMHLQRLANPLLPWNPTPTKTDGTADPQYVSNLPVNPYLSVDSLALDLTAYNGSSSRETSVKAGVPGKHYSANANDKAAAEHSKKRGLPYQSNASTGSYTGTVMNMSSQERGVRPYAVGSTTQELAPGRVPWRQETPTIAAEVTANQNAQNPLGRVTQKEIVTTQTTVQTEVDNDVTDGLLPSPVNVLEMHVDFGLRHSLGYLNRNAGELIAKGPENAIDANGDGTTGEMMGAPKIVTTNNNAATPSTLLDDSTNPYFTWNNRPFANEGELLQVPAASSSRMLAYYSTFNANLTTQPNGYSGDVQSVNITPAITAQDAEKVNAERWAKQHAPFGHLLNALQTSATPARVVVNPTGSVVVATGAPNFAHILDYVHVPSKFVATDLMLSPTTFQSEALPSTDPRANFSAPFNRVAEYREPGKVNLNTVVGRRTDSVNSWSEVYDGLMHRVQDANYITDPNNTPANRNDDVLSAMGHLGPAWRDVVISRRGYVDPTIIGAGNLDSSPMTLNPNFPSVVSNPFRTADAGDLVPLQPMVQTPVDASMLRSHPYSPGADGAWGSRNVDDAWGSSPRELRSRRRR